ncbi:cytochrome-c peroxidase [Xylophilus rhododendri]|uniref:Cytochrome-c peroxidase n=1 Tax=Xylophilus rhododendri TaxID=2697032 RepID=A0A857JBR2_9BURK|nr:cytochrome c peroxidase [Xylophilus rhododendri]QHJ00520.1 cytochrome-c peroxidase [Xylophilus rhododendri]
MQKTSPWRARARRSVLGPVGLCCLLGLATLAGCDGGAKTASAVPEKPAAVASAPAAPRDPFEPVQRPLSAAAQLGKVMFVDARLSGSGKMSCATCHDPGHAYGPPNDLAVQLGGGDLASPGTRAVPSLRYKDTTPPYADLLDNPDGVSVPGPGGGFAWDGRAATLADQAPIPLLAPNEMGNTSEADVIQKIRNGPYAEQFRQAFGAQVFDDPHKAFMQATSALQAYQLEDVSFHPYTSKFDRYAGNKIGGTLTAAEARGLRVFSNPQTGNCASCHYQGAGLNGASALFTDFSYEAIGVPRNREIAANQDARHFDLGLCGPDRSDHPPVAGNTFCGMFKAPTLRNVATRKSFFHNGAMHSLEQVLRFYNTRDTMPEIWYPTVGGKPKAQPDADFPTYGLITTQYVGGKVQKYDDLPPRFVANIDTQMPMDGRARHTKPPMSEQDLADLQCFLKTLDDGYKTQAADAPAPPAGSPCIQ